MAVEVVVLDCSDAMLVEFSIQTEVSHSVAHLVADILDDASVRLLLLLEYLDDIFEVDKQLTVFLFWPVAIEMPAIHLEVLMEFAKHRLLGLGRY